MGTAPPTTPGPLGTPSLELGPDGAVASERTCVVCAYSLRGLLATGHCPECGTPVANSLRGNLLKYCSPEYLARLHRGVSLILGAIIVVVLMMILSFGLVFLGGGWGGGAWGNVGSAIGLAASVALLYGWWLFSGLDPGYAAQDSGTTARKVVRGAVVVRAGTDGVSTLISLLPPSAFGPAPGGPLFMVAAVLGLLSILAFIVQYFAAMRYLRWLAPRIPDESIRKRAQTLTWAGPLLCTVGAILAGIGILVAIVLYWNLLDRVRKELKRIRDEQALATLAGAYAGER